MAEGGFLVKFDGKEAMRCYAVSFDYDRWEYTINGKKKRALPPNLEKISVEIEIEE